MTPGFKLIHGRILIVTLSNIGDAILTSPVIAQMAGQFPDAKITVVAGPLSAPILEDSRMIHQLLIYDKRKSWAHKIGLITTLRKHRYDFVIDLRNTAIPFLVSARKRSPLIRWHKPVQMRESHLQILRRMGFEIQDLPPMDFFSEEDSLHAKEILLREGAYCEKGVIAVAPIAASELKTWRLSGFAEVIDRLVRSRPEKIIILGDRRAAELTGPLGRMHPNRVYNFCGETTLRESAALIALAKLVITNDSSMMHLARELKCRIAAVFGPTNPAKFEDSFGAIRIITAGVPCAPCEKTSCRFERQHCFEDLKSEPVFLACEELLNATR